MAEGYVPYNGEKQAAKVLSGFGEGPFFKKANVAPTMDFVDGYPESVNKSLDSMKIAPPIPFDPWVYRRPNAKMK